MRRHAKAIVAISAMLLTLAFAAGSSLALQTHKEGAQVSGASTPNQGANGGGFGPLGGLAVAGGGDLYVIDAAGSASSGLENTGAVHRFDSAGAYQDTIDGADTEPPSPVGLGLSSDSRVAVDASGNLFLTDTNNNRVLAFSGSGAALSSFGSDGQIDGSESLPGSEDKTPTNGFGGYLCGIAVDPVNGDILVSDAFNNRVWIFDATGKYQGRVADSVQLNGPCGLAFDSTGDLYVRNWFAANVVKFHRSGDRAFDFERVAYQPDNFTPEDPSDDLPEPTDVAVDMTTNNLFVDGATQITEFEQSGGLLTRFAKGAFTSGFSASIAVDGAGGRIYASDGNLLRTFSTTVTTLPDATTGAAEEITGESAVLTGTVDGLGIETECVFEYGADASYGQSAPCEPAGPYLGSQAVSAQIEGLSAGTTYHYRLRATTPVPDEFTNGADRTFLTNGAPVIISFSAADALTTTARLTAQINPAGAETSYRFEYVTLAEFEANGFANAVKVPLPDGTLAAANSPQPVAETVSGLAPASRYRFRVVAVNAIDATESATKSFQTFATPGAFEKGPFPGQGFLPDNRAWELVSPPNKLGSDVMVETSRTRAAASESAGLPMAATFASLGGFADAGLQGAGISFEYMAERTARPGTNGWSTHAITPRQDSLSFFGAALTLDPIYEGEFDANLTRGFFRSWSPLTDAPNVASSSNLYLRKDLRDPGAGSYHLASDAVVPVPPVTAGTLKPFLAGASADLEHVIFESRRNLTADATGGNVKLYKSDRGVVRLLTPGHLSCPGGATPTTPCSAAGLGATSLFRTDRTISEDGSRVAFSAPVESAGGVIETAGVVGKLFQLDDRGTAEQSDDAIVQVSASEKATPETTRKASFQVASTDGSRIFFTSNEQLTDASGGGLYLWERQLEDETQSLAVDATGGSFTLTSSSQPSVGTAELADGSDVLSGVTGSFAVGQSISGPGIPAGTTITAMGAFTSPFFNDVLTLSAPVTATGSAVRIEASTLASTAPIPFDAPAAQIEAALEALPSIGEGNVTVAGGSGSYQLTFTGALAGVNVPLLSADGSLLSGGAGTAEVTATEPVSNLTLIGSASGALGASEDGRHLYFTGNTQLVPGGPALTENGFFHWQDADGVPGGTISFIGAIQASDAASNLYSAGVWNLNRKVSRVTPDGDLLFTVAGGGGLAPGYDHGECPTGNPNGGGGGCSQSYLYRPAGSTPLEPDLRCVTCIPSGVPATANAFFDIRSGTGGSIPSWHLTRAITDDGRYVFFSTEARLVPRDINGVLDAYRYDVVSGEYGLLSSGESPKPSYYVESSADGADVFIVTSERLSAWDVDGNRDLYDARVNGGFPEPPPPPPGCEGDACQPPPGALNDPSPASANFNGSGNPPGPRSKSRCPKGKRAVQTRGGKMRCAAKKPKKRSKHQRATNTNRRAGR